MTTAYVGMGSNLGDRAGTLRRAVVELQRLDGVQVRRSSRFRLTRPVGGPAQGDYVNAVLELESPWSPMHLLEELLQVEHRFGRRRTVLHGPRTLDLDLLWFGRREVQHPRLQLPHPRMAERRFVLEPLVELVPKLPLSGKVTAQQQLHALEEA